jgi:hypothetical protein
MSVDESESLLRRGRTTVGSGAAGLVDRRGDVPPVRGTDRRANPEQVVGRGANARGTETRARTPPQDGPARNQRRERVDPGPVGALPELEAREPRRPGPNATNPMRRVAARYRSTRLASTTRIRIGRCIAHVCRRNETSRTARDPGRWRADETNWLGCEVIEPGPAAEPGRGRDQREQPAAGQVSDYTGRQELTMARQGH